MPALRRRPWPWVLIGFFGLLVLQGTFRVDFDGGLPIDPSPSWKFGHLDESLELAILLVGVPAGLVAAARAGVSRTILAGSASPRWSLVVVLGRTQQEQYLDDRYRANVAPPLDGGFRSTPEWKPLQEFGKAATDRDIGVVGRASAFGQYFFYGDDLSNSRPVPGPGAAPRHLPPDRQLPGAAQDDQQGRLRLRRRHPAHPARDEDPARELWVGEDPAARALVRSGGAVGGAGDLAAVFKIDGELDPSTCADAEREFRKAKAEEQKAKLVEFRALERSLGEDLDDDGVVGR